MKIKKANPTEYESKVINSVLHYIINGLGEDAKVIIRYDERRLLGDEEFHFTGKSSQWVYSNGRLESMDAFHVPVDDPLKCTDFLFEYGKYWFSFTNEKLSFSYQLGPLFGLGTIYDYSIDDNGRLRLSNPEEQWVS